MSHASAAHELQASIDGEQNLLGTPLQPCTTPDDTQPTGFTRTGSCQWEPDDSGYHEVCAVMSAEFLNASATQDANDLTSVVQTQIVADCERLLAGVGGVPAVEDDA